MNYLEEHRELVRALQAAEKHRSSLDFTPMAGAYDVIGLRVQDKIAKEMMKKESNRW
jgi:hypothetical protein